MDIEHELRAMDQARLTTDGIHFDIVEGQAWLNRGFQERLYELEVELFDTGVLKEEGASNERVITTFVPPNLERRLGTVPAVTNYRQQSSSEPCQRTDVQGRLGEAPMRRIIHPRRRLMPVNPMEETTSTSRSDTRSETTSTSREERRPDRGSLMWSRPIPSPWHVYKDELMKLDLQRVSFIEDARRMLNGARLSVSRLYSITGIDWLIAAGINFSSTTALSFADLEGLPSNNTMGPVNTRPLQDVRLNHDEGNREERPGRFLTTRAPIGQHVKMFRQVATPPSHVKERTYPKQVSQDGDVQRYGGLKAIKDATKEGSFTKATPRVVFALSPGYACLPDGLKFVHAIVTLLSEGKYDVIISAPNRMIEMENLRPLRAELPAVWSDISNAMRGFKDHALRMLVSDEVLGLDCPVSVDSSNLNRE